MGVVPRVGFFSVECAGCFFVPGALFFGCWGLRGWLGGCMMGVQWCGGGCAGVLFSSCMFIR